MVVRQGTKQASCRPNSKTRRHSTS